MPTENGAASRAERPSSTNWREVFGLLQAAATETGEDKLRLEYLCETCAKTSLVRAHFEGSPLELFFALERCVARRHRLTRIR